MRLDEVEVGKTYVVVKHRSCVWLDGERVTVTRIVPAAKYPVVTDGKGYVFAPSELSPLPPEGE